VKDDFLAIVSHELKTPLNTIAGWTTILKSDHLSASTKETALQKIEKNLRLQAKMVEQILSFSQIMAEDRPLSLAPVSASEIFAKAIRAIEPAAAEKSVAFSSSNELNGQMINADPETIGMALGNILSNAVKFTPSGGMIQARALSENGDVRFVVEDNGSGIEPDFIPHVFEHYKQGAEPATRSYGGLGLGLAITKHIVDLHGGSVETASEGLGRGAQFTVSIPEIKVSESN
jgi:signal transduction histidine kinase